LLDTISSSIQKYFINRLDGRLAINVQNKGWMKYNIGQSFGIHQAAMGPIQVMAVGN